MKSISIILLLSLLTNMAYCKDEFPKIQHHWLRAAPPNARMQAAYAELINDTLTDKILIGAYSPHFKTAEIHKTTITNNVAKMQHQSKITIKAGDSLLFKPGGLHIMLMQPTSSIKINESIKICLIYKQGQTISVQHIMFPVQKK